VAGRWPVGVVVEELALGAVAVPVDLVEHTRDTATGTVAGYLS
jgi:hypothetical protein